MKDKDYERIVGPLLIDNDDVLEGANTLLDLWINRNSNLLTQRDVEYAESRLARANDKARDFGSLKTPAFQFHHVLTVRDYAVEMARDVSRVYPFLDVHPENVAYMALVHDIGRILSNHDSQGIHEFTGILYCLSLGLGDIVDSGQIHFVAPQMLKLMQSKEDRAFDPRFANLELPNSYERNPMHHIVTVADASCANARLGVKRRIADINVRYPKDSLLYRALNEAGGEQYLLYASEGVDELRSGRLSEEEVRGFYNPITFH